MAINVTVTSVVVAAGIMTIGVESTNTDYPAETETFTIEESQTQTLEGIKRSIEATARTVWAGHNNPSWQVPEI